MNSQATANKAGALVRSWRAYAVCAFAVTAAVALLLVGVGVGTASAVWFGAGLAYGLQLIAFGALLAVRDRAQLLLAGWLTGMVLRFGAVGLSIFWLSRNAVLPRDPAVLSLAGFMFLLLLLEPVFLRWDLRRS